MFTDEQLPISDGEDDQCGGDLELQLMAAMLALSARSFLKEEQSSVRRKRARYSVPEQTRGPDNASLPPRAASPARSEPLSEITVGYVSISPSPSELACPNLLYASRDNLIDEHVDYSPVLSKVSFSSLVVLREALLPFFVLSGLQIEPQLRTLCHNSAEYLLDLTIEMREVTAFVCKSIDLVSSSSSPVLSHLTSSGSPTLIGEQLALSGCVRYCTSPQTGRVQRSQRITLLKPSFDELRRESKRETNSENKTNISCKFCVSLENLNSTVTTPLLKLSRHMTETARFRTKVRKQALTRAEDLVATPRPDLDEEVEPRVIVVEESVDSGERGLEDGGQISAVEQFANGLIDYLSRLEHEALPHVKESGAATPTSTTGSGINMRVFEYSRSPKVSKSLATGAASAVGETEAGRLAVPTGYGQPDGWNGKVKMRRMSTGSNSSNISGNDIAIHMEGVYTPPDHTHNNTSPEEVLSTQDTYGDDTTDMFSSDAERERAKRRRHRVKVKSHDPDDASIDGPQSVDGHTHFSPIKVFSMSEGELLYSVYGLLKVNRVGCEVKIETTKMSLELSAISAAVDVRKSLTPVKPVHQRSPSVDELDQLLHFDLLPTYLSVSATLRKSLIRINDRGLPENDILLFSALPVYVSVGVLNHTHQNLPTYRCLLKFAGLELDIRQSPVKVHRRYQQLLPAFTKIYNDVFASSSVEGDPLEQQPVVTTPSQATPNMSKLTGLKLPSHLPRGVIHFKIDKMNLIMAPLPSLTVTYYVSTPASADILLRMVNIARL